MTSRTRRKIGLAWATALAGFLGVHIQASDAVSLVSAPLLSRSVSTTLPPVQVSLPPVHVSLPPVQVSLPPVVSPPPVHVSPPPVHVSPPPVHVSLPPVQVSPPVHVSSPPVHVAPVPAGSIAPAVHLTIPGALSVTAVPATTSSTSGPASGKALARSPSMAQRPAATAMNGRWASTPSGQDAGSSPLSAPFSGYGTSGRSGRQHSATSRRNSRLSKPERARRLKLIAAVRRLEGCLGNLPDRLRLVLELSTGIDATRVLSPAAIAAFLHIRVGQIPRLERQALQRLRRAARTDACVGARHMPSGLPVLSGFGPPLGNGVATGGVEGVRYAKSPSRAPRGLGEKRSSPGIDTLLGINAPPAASEAWLVILVVLPGVLLVAFLFADQLGLGPRHWRWRLPWTRRPPR
jgi:hypothetical protein